MILERKKLNGTVPPTPERRLAMLRRLINIKKPVRCIEVHDGLSALVAENCKVGNRTFDALWDSSLCSSASRGLPDVEMVDLTARFQTIQEIPLQNHYMKY